MSPYFIGSKGGLCHENVQHIVHDAQKIVHENVHENVHGNVHGIVHENVHGIVYEIVQEIVHGIVHENVHEILHDNVQTFKRSFMRALFCSSKTCFRFALCCSSFSAYILILTTTASTPSLSLNMSTKNVLGNEILKRRCLIKMKNHYLSTLMQEIIDHISGSNSKKNLSLLTKQFISGP